MTYGHLRADCLYTGISSGPNARYRGKAFTFLPFYEAMTVNCGVVVGLNMRLRRITRNIYIRLTVPGQRVVRNARGLSDIDGGVVENEKAAPGVTVVCTVVDPRTLGVASARRLARPQRRRRPRHHAVSYTHLTLPTILRV